MKMCFWEFLGRFMSVLGKSSLISLWLQDSFISALTHKNLPGFPLHLFPKLFRGFAKKKRKISPAPLDASFRPSRSDSSERKKKRRFLIHQGRLVAAVRSSFRLHLKSFPLLLSRLGRGAVDRKTVLQRKNQKKIRQTSWFIH